MTFDDWEDEWETDLTTFGSTVESSLVQSRLLPLVFSGILCVASFGLLFWGSTLLGYIIGLASSMMAFVAMLDDRKRQANINFSQTAPVSLLANSVRISATLLCLVHIVRLAGEAAK